MVQYYNINAFTFHWHWLKLAIICQSKVKRSKAPLRMAKGSKRRSGWKKDGWWNPTKNGKWGKGKRIQKTHTHVWPLSSKAAKCECEGFFIDLKGRKMVEFWCLGRAIVFNKLFINKKLSQVQNPDQGPDSGLGARFGWGPDPMSRIWSRTWVSTLQDLVQD